MLNIKVTYFLSEKGQYYFPTWYEEVLAITSQQVGFQAMRVEYNENNPTVFLSFENKELLDQWRIHPKHDELVGKLAGYLIRPKQVETF